MLYSFDLGLSLMLNVLKVIILIVIDILNELNPIAADTGPAHKACAV